jgi:hypothetical protein
LGVTPVRTASRDGRGEGMVSIFVRNSVGCPRTGSIFAASRSARSSACLAMLASLRFLEIAAAYGLKVLRFGLKAPDRQGPVVAIARTSYLFFVFSLVAVYGDWQESEKGEGFTGK